MILLLLALGCGGEPAVSPAPSAGSPVVPLAPGTNGTTTTASPAPLSATPTIWKADNIDQLVPVAPTRRTTVGKAIPAVPAYDTALQDLGKIVETYAGHADNPWAVAHGILARGSSFRLVDGREAIPHLFSTYAEPRSVGTRTLLGFPRKLADDTPVEPHTDLLLKNMGEMGVAPDATFPTRTGTAAIADLYRYTVLKSFLVVKGNKSSYDAPNDMPWGLQALAQWAPPGELQWIATDGTPMDLDFLASFTVTVLTQESAFMFQAMQRGQSFERQGQNLFSYTCGGAHLLQGATYAVARGYGTPKDRKAVEAQVPLMFYRLPIELGIYDEGLKRNPKYKARLLVQRMKFLGHWLESMGKMQAMGLYTPDDKQVQIIEGAAQNLVLAVNALKKLGVFDNMETLKTEDNQLYLDVIGDSCHAVRGLELALGRGSIAW